MTHDVRQWLAEIKSLQQQLAEAYQERDQAYAGAANWRKLYETEAHQRRTDMHLAQQTIDQLKAELQSLQEPLSSDRPVANSLQQEVELHTTEELRSHLIQLKGALQAEQAEHEKTRKALMGALGDTVGLLAKERARQAGSDSSGQTMQREETLITSAKTPSPEQPMLDQAQFPA